MIKPLRLDIDIFCIFKTLLEGQTLTSIGDSRFLLNEASDDISQDLRDAAFYARATGALKSAHPTLASN